MSVAKEWLAGKLGEAEPGSGIAIAAQSPRINRTELICWTINHYAGAAEPNESVRVVYVGCDAQMVRKMRIALENTLFASQKRRGWHLEVAADTIVLPQLAQFTYMTTATAQRLAGQFPLRIDLVVLDERHADEMNPLAGPIAQARPLLTLLVTKQLPENHPWQHFGEPLVLQGPARRPPTSPTADKPSV